MELFFHRWCREGNSRTRGKIAPEARAVFPGDRVFIRSFWDQFVDGIDESAGCRGESAFISRRFKPVARKAKFKVGRGHFVGGRMNP